MNVYQNLTYQPIAVSIQNICKYSLKAFLPTFPYQSLSFRWCSVLMAARQVLIPDNQNFDNQSFDSPNSSSLPSSSAGSRKRPLSETPHHDLFAKAHKASLETGLVPLEMGAGCKIVSQDFEKIKNAKNIGHSKNLCQYPGHRTTQVYNANIFGIMEVLGS